MKLEVLEERRIARSVEAVRQVRGESYMMSAHAAVIGQEDTYKVKFSTSSRARSSLKSLGPLRREV